MMRLGILLVYLVIAWVLIGFNLVTGWPAWVILGVLACIVFAYLASSYTRRR